MLEVLNVPPAVNASFELGLVIWKTPMRAVRSFLSLLPAFLAIVRARRLAASVALAIRTSYSPASVEM